MSRLDNWTKGRVIATILSVVLALYLIYIRTTNKCDMSANLYPLFATGVRHFETINASYWLDYGSLLGATRDGGIVPWEFDVDFSMFFEDCEKYRVLKEPLKAEGYTLYMRDEKVPPKENWLLGYDPYLHKACARIYDSSFKYYIDLDWYKRMSYAEAKAEEAKEAAAGRLLSLPAGYKESDGDVVCNLEGWDQTDPGGCRLLKWILPLQRMKVKDINTYAPANIEANLVAMYGPNWRIPRQKGYKILLCGWFPQSTIAFVLLWLLLSSLPYAAWRFGPPLYDRCMIAIGRRNVTHKYAALPLATKASP